MFGQNQESINDQILVLRLVTERLHDVGIAYMVSGSTAMNFYAQPRMTRDIDIVVELNRSDVNRIVELFSSKFYIDADVAHAAITGNGFFNIIHNDTLVKVDFIVRKNTPYRREEFSRRKWIETQESRLLVVTAEDLMLSKLAWAKDSHSELQINDVRNIAASVTDLDWDYLAHWATHLDVNELLDLIKK